MVVEGILIMKNTFARSQNSSFFTPDKRKLWYTKRNTKKKN